ncbi:MAG: GNAT family N-acetyltransferase [Acidobacteriota bacterium]|nr:GNAT family N-acetyltransferase [Acidobacteriota bacterium]
MEATTTRGAAPRVELRPAAPEDYEFLLEVYASTRADELAQVPWDDATKRAFCRQQYDAQKADYDARFPAARYDVILLDGRPAGRIWVERDDGEIRLLDIALLPWAQRRGVGSSLVGELIEEARASGRRLRHMVFMYNEGARRLYERLGFVVFEEQGAYLHMEWRGGAGEGDSGTDDEGAETKAVG